MKGSDTNKKLCQVVPHLFSSKNRITEKFENPEPHQLNL